MEEIFIYDMDLDPIVLSPVVLSGYTYGGLYHQQLIKRGMYYPLLF